MGIYRFDIYRCPNIGIFLKGNDKLLLLPRGLAATKTSKLSSFLGVEPIKVSIGGSRLLGPLVALNSRGALVSRMIEDEEIRTIIQNEATTGLRVERIQSRYTSIGNLIAANDNGAIVSDLFTKDTLRKITDILDVPVEVMNVASYSQVGAMIVTTNTGAIIHPHASDKEILKAAEVLRVKVEPVTINGGVPFVASGIVANSRNAVVGTLTSGPELMMLTRAFGI